MPRYCADLFWSPLAPMVNDDTFPRSQSPIPNPVVWPLKDGENLEYVSEYEFTHHMDNCPPTENWWFPRSTLRSSLPEKTAPVVFPPPGELPWVANPPVTL